MAFDGLLVSEIFHSVQGETSLVGVPFVFVRLTGCNLRCTYCDTAYAFKGGTRMSLEEVLAEVARYPAHHVLLTGGEPLMQRQSPALARALSEKGYAVSIETHGEADLSAVTESARIVMDIKTPSSGMCRRGFEQNLKYLKRDRDEVKFVIASENDYEFARDWVRSGKIQAREILFSPALPAPGAPGTFPGVALEWLAEQILRDGLNVRFQYQLHKLIWGPSRRGV